MYANPQTNRLNTIAVRASHILPILKRFPSRENRGVVYFPLGNNQTRNQFVFLSFGEIKGNPSPSLISIIDTLIH